MDMIKVNELLGEIVHLASAAILCDDEAVKRQAIGDIAEAVAGLRDSANGRDARCPEEGDCNGQDVRCPRRPAFLLPTIPSGADGTEPAKLSGGEK